MIRVGIIGDLQEEGEIYQTLHKSKEVEPVGLYSPGRDFRSATFRIYHNPIELLELSDAILICNTERISADFIRVVIRKSKHIYFHRPPVLSSPEIADLLKLQKEAGTVIHLFSPLLGMKPGILPGIKPGVKIVSLQLAIQGTEKNLSSEILNALVFLGKIENSPVKHSDVLAIKSGQGFITLNIHSLCSNGSVHNVLFSDKNISPEIQIFQKDHFIRFSTSGNTAQDEKAASPDDPSFQNFIASINGKNSESISFEDFYNCQKSFLDIREKLAYSGIEI
ncbi:MAG: hypothetical protein RBS73_16140 [Prolixibacteraceae bacterium]|jgi:hypothetical protein|nr:hypothetical protein [Prolixibacteraceae bacterium]